jgi:hypothetical protein
MGTRDTERFFLHPQRGGKVVWYCRLLRPLSMAHRLETFFFRALLRPTRIRGTAARHDF